MTESGIDYATAAGLADALRRLFEAGHKVIGESATANALQQRIIDHLGCGLTEIAFVGEDFANWEHVNVQRGVDVYLAEHTPESSWFGVNSMNRPFDDFAAIINQAGHFGSGESAASLGSVASGPDATMEVVNFGMIASIGPDGEPIVIGMRAESRLGQPTCRLEVMAARRETAVAARDEINRLRRQHDVFRGQVLTFSISEHGDNDMLGFLPRPDLSADQVILPAGVLEVIERHTLGISDQAEQLRRAGQHLKRGLLLHGVPGTGKTHTVRYLMTRMRECTVILMTGPAMRHVEVAASLARRLQPAVVVLEDVDLIAEDREYTPFSGSPLLFALLDAMDGVGADNDVTFVLTTNRAEVLERALADRPGRVDLAVEIPRPDAEARERLFQLYAGTLELPADLGPVVAATEGVTASFIKEITRRAVLTALRTSPEVSRLTAADFDTVLTEISTEREALTRSLLGDTVEQPLAPLPSHPHQPAPPAFPPPPRPGGPGMTVGSVIYGPGA